MGLQGFDDLLNLFILVFRSCMRFFMFVFGGWGGCYCREYDGVDERKSGGSSSLVVVVASVD